MPHQPHIIFTVTNDLVFDQRMHRICTTLSDVGYKVTLVGRLMPDSPKLTPKKFEQIRLKLNFHSGKLFYIQYNLRLYRFLRRQKADAICAIDLDTIVPVYYAAKKLKCIKALDAHEYFTEMNEIKRRPGIYKIWHWVERRFMPEFHNGYTVGYAIANSFKNIYNLDYEVVRNMPLKNPNTQPNPDALQQAVDLIDHFNRNTDSSLPVIMYQGAVNEARGLIQLIDAMKNIPARLIIAGTGNTFEETHAHLTQQNLGHKIIMTGNIRPEVLKHLTNHCYIGINLVENTGLNQYYSLANKYFDYIMASKPQVSMNYPEYKRVNDTYDIALLIDNVEVPAIENAINQLLNNAALYQRLANNCINAASQLNWEKESEKLVTFWKSILPA
ncbi:glycosyltransferase [Polluticaenibacter yanchengensis]|uniref:Glycosyltransferase n=1 Tax=Polluticaenibacter yanchengensis TaxID=3014562 RepID=A0ABT4UK91_9BACT|nr:glycosyltransferase [Chitinophagaceae bacterium LY-5]